MRVDPRGPRFAAAVTTVVLAVVLLTGSGWLLLAQLFVFGAGAVGKSPYGQVFRRWIRPRLTPPAHMEDAAPPRFAQKVGFGFALVGTVGFLGGVAWLGVVATAFALAAAFLNAAFGFCLGCEMYLLIRRTTHRGVTA